MAKKNADRNQEIYAPRSIWKHSQTIAREERYEGGKRLRIPLNSKKKPKPSRSSQTCPNCNGIQEKKEMKEKKNINIQVMRRKQNASEMLGIWTIPP